MAKTGSKAQRRNNFIIHELEKQAEAFAAAAFDGINFGQGERTKEQIRMAIAAAYVTGAGSALDAEDGTQRIPAVLAKVESSR